MGNKIIKIIKLIFKTRCWLYLKALMYGVAAGVEHNNVLRGLNCKTVIDVGANCGQFSLVSRRCFPQAQIFAFEPLSRPANKFYAIFQNEECVTLHKTAIGPKACKATCYVTNADDSSSLLKLKTLHKKIFPGIRQKGTEIVKVARLTDYLSTENIALPALLKLDVQGYELEALKGCEDLLNNFSFVYAECSFMELYSGQVLVDDVIDWLRERGWFLGGIYNMIYDYNGKSVQADFLFQNSHYTKL